MSNVVIKYSVMEGYANTNQNKSFSGNSPVTVTLSNGQTYTFGPNQTHVFADNFAVEVLAQDNRLKEVSRS